MSALEDYRSASHSTLQELQAAQKPPNTVVDTAPHLAAASVHATLALAAAVLRLSEVLQTTRRTGW